MSRKSLYAFIAAFLLLVSVIILNRLSFNRLRDFSQRVEHTREVITTFESLSNDFKSAQLYSHSYDTGQLRHLFHQYRIDADSIQGELRSLHALLADNAEQTSLINQVDTIIQAHIHALMVNNTDELARQGQYRRLNEVNAVHQLIETGVGREKELLHQRKLELDSAMRIVNLVSASFGVLGVGIVLFTFFSNFRIARRRRWLEGFLESVLNTSQNGIIYYKAIKKDGQVVDFRLNFINHAIDRLLQIDSAGLLGKKMSEASSLTMRTDLFARYADVLNTGQPATFEMNYVRGNVERWLLVSLARLKDGVTATFHDISQLKKYEAELQEHIHDLKRSNTELEQYAYIASHDLQEPLRKIRAFSTYLQDTQAERLNDRGRQQLDKIIASAERMSTLIKDILELSSLRKREAVESVDLNQVVKTVLQDLELMITQKQVQIQSDRLPVIEANTLQMTQLFYNLLNNALKFLKKEGLPQIHVYCRKLSKADVPSVLPKELTYYKLSFTDNGIGFNPDYADQIFGLFKRLNDRQYYPGSGIGLALCKKVVDNHHGLITTHSREQEGATFHVYLPEKQPPKEEMEAQ